MATYYVETTDKTVDGDTFCGGACTASDIIIIRGGPRGALLLQDFDGSGSYIPIINEDISSRVEIVSNGDPGTGVFSINNCKYVDLRGDNHAGSTYGIKVRDDGTPGRSGAVKVYGESDHIKLGYLETDHIGKTTITGIGIQVQDVSLSSAWTFDTFEIHHNYIHDTRYCGMYLGHNNPASWGEDNPYCARFSVHDNILKDLGTYGMVLKGLNGGSNSFYNNFVDTTGVVSRADITDEWRTGIRLRTYTTSYNIEVYNNTVFNTVGPGILAGKGSHNIHDNIVCGCGTSNHVDWGHGIETYLGTTGTHIYDNIIIQPTRYGIYNKSSATAGVTLSRNIIGDAGLGEWAEVSAGDTVESSGDDANWYEADVANFGFTAWSDDGNYYNDIFTFGGDPYTRSRGILRKKPRYNMVGGRFR